MTVHWPSDVAEAAKPHAPWLVFVADDDLRQCYCTADIAASEAGRRKTEVRCIVGNIDGYAIGNCRVCPQERLVGTGTRDVTVQVGENDKALVPGALAVGVVVHRIVAGADRDGCLGPGGLTARDLERRMEVIRRCRNTAVARKFRQVWNAHRQDDADDQQCDHQLVQREPVFAA